MYFFQCGSISVFERNVQGCSMITPKLASDPDESTLLSDSSSLEFDFLRFLLFFSIFTPFFGFFLSSPEEPESSSLSLSPSSASTDSKISSSTLSSDSAIPSLSHTRKRRSTCKQQRHFYNPDPIYIRYAFGCTFCSHTVFIGCNLRT